MRLLTRPRPTARRTHSRQFSRLSPHMRPLTVEALEERVLLSGVPQLLKDINPDAGYSDPWGFVEMGEDLYFVADDGTNGHELWKSDGTPSGTQMVKDIRPGSSIFGPQTLTEMNGTLYFAAFDTTSSHLWKSDGTEAGTVLVTAHPDNPSELTAAGGMLYFTNGASIYASDGTPEGTLHGPLFLGTPRNLTDVGGTLYFSMTDQIWKSEGTFADMVMVKDVNSGYLSYPPISNLTVFDGTLYFTAADGILGNELWRSDGTEAGTGMVKDINPGAGSSDPGALTVAGGTLYFGATDGTNGRELWRTDGTPAGTVRVKDANPGAGSSHPSDLAAVGGTLYYTATDGIHGRELWRSDGTPAGTGMVEDINPVLDSPSNPSDLADVGGTLYFTATDGTHGYELWESDGTPAGTRMAMDIQPGPDSSYPHDLTNVGGDLYFAANDGLTGDEPWIWPLSVPHIEWIRQFGSEGPANDTASAADADGNVYVAGTTAGTFPGQTSAGGSDAFVRKYDSSGTELWTRQFGTSSSERATGISVDGSGVYVAGWTLDTLPGQTSAGYWDAFVRKYDSNGSEVWTRQFGASESFDSVRANGISVDASGVYVAGDTTGTVPSARGGPQTSAGGDDAFVRKYDSSGREVWTSQFGSSARDVANGVSVDASGVYVVGQTYGDLAGQTSVGAIDAFVRKYDSSGMEVWTRQFGSPKPSSNIAQAVDAGGNVYVAGHTWGALPGQTSAGERDVFVRKYDSSGTELWTRQYGTSSRDVASGISVDASGYVYVAGETGGTLPGQTSAGGTTDTFVRKYDSNGNELWTRQFGTSGYDQARGISVDTSGRVYVVGSTGGTLPGQTSSGAFVRKYDSNGTEVWTRQFGTPVYGAWPFGISVDVSGVYVAGETYGIFPGQSSSGNVDAFVRKYDLDGNHAWTRQFGTINWDKPRGISVDASGVYVAGNTLGTLTSADGVPQTRVGGKDAFVRKYDLTGNEVWTRQFGASEWDYANGISVDASGVYVAGDTRGTLPGQTRAGGPYDHDAFVRKYDTSGTELWTRQFGTSSRDAAYGVSVDPSGVYVVGRTDGSLPGQTSSGGTDVFIVKLVDVHRPIVEGVDVGTDLKSLIVQLNDDDLDPALATNTANYKLIAANGDADADGDPFNDGDELELAISAIAYDPVTDRITLQTEDLLFEDYFRLELDGDGLDGPDLALDGTPIPGGTPGITDLDGNFLAGSVLGDVTATLDTHSITVTLPPILIESAVLEASRQFGGSSTDAALAATTDETGIYVAGFTDGTLPGQTSAGGRDAFVRKLDFAGNVLWTRQFGSALEDRATGVGLSPDGTALFVGGMTAGALPGQVSFGGSDGFVRRYDLDGNLIWTRQYGTPGDERAMATINSPAVFVAGSTTGAFPGFTNLGGTDAFYLQYDFDGNLSVIDQFGTPSDDVALGLDSTAIEGALNVFVAGTTAGAFPDQTSAGGTDAFLRRYDAAGNVVWTQQFGSTLDDSAIGVGIPEDTDGVIVGGATAGTLPGQTSFGGIDGYLRRYDFDGNEVWTRQYGTTGDEFCNDPLVNCGIIINSPAVFVAGPTTGAFPGFTNAGGTDAFYLKYDVDGNLLATTQFGTSGDDQAFGMAHSSDFERVYIVGQTTGTFPDQTSAGAADGFLVELVRSLNAPIDIKPGSFPNSINLGSHGTIPVAIFSTPTFDATTIDPLTVTLAEAQTRLRGRGTPMASVEDVNGDGLLDLVVHVETEALQLTETDAQAEFSAKTFDGASIQRFDSIRVVAALHVAGGPAEGVMVADGLTRATLNPVVQQSVAHWAAAGVEPRRLDALRQLDVQIADLSDSLLGVAALDTVWIDRDAAGYGWSVNSGGVDLFSAVTHEFGHVLGLGHTQADDLMGRTLAVGERQQPAPSLILGSFAGEVYGSASDLAVSIWSRDRVFGRLGETRSWGILGAPSGGWLHSTPATVPLSRHRFFETLAAEPDHARRLDDDWTAADDNEEADLFDRLFDGSQPGRRDPDADSENLDGRLLDEDVLDELAQLA